MSFFDTVANFLLWTGYYLLNTITDVMIVYWIGFRLGWWGVKQEKQAPVEQPQVSNVQQATNALGSMTELIKTAKSAIAEVSATPPPVQPANNPYQPVANRGKN